MQGQSTTNGQVLDVFSLIPDGRDLEKKIGRFHIVLDEAGHPVEIRKRHSILGASGSFFTKESVLSLLAQDGISKKVYEDFIQQYINYR